MNVSDIPELDSKIIRNGPFTTLGFFKRGESGRLICAPGASGPYDWANARGVAGIITDIEIENSPKDMAIIKVEDPVRTFLRVHEWMLKEGKYFAPFEKQIGKRVKIDPSAKVASDSVRIGDDCEIGPNAVVERNAILGKGVNVGPGSIIGSGAPFMQRVGEDTLRLLPGGGVILEDEVEIHANCSICRGAFKENTVIGRNTRIDNLVTIGHGTSIGEVTAIAASANIGAFVEIGKGVWIGPNAAVDDFLSIGDKANISIGAAVVEDVAREVKVSGNFAIEHSRLIDFIKKMR